MVSLLAAALLFAGCTPVGKKEEAASAAPTESKESAEKGDSKPADYASTLAAAKKDGKLLLLKFTASWCPPCQEMKKAMKDDMLLREEIKNYEVLEVDIDNAKNQALRDKFYPDGGIPFVIVLKPGDESRVTDMLGFDDGPAMARALKAARTKV